MAGWAYSSKWSDVSVDLLMCKSIYRYEIKRVCQFLLTHPLVFIMRKLYVFFESQCLHHATHAWCSHWHLWLVLLGIADDALCGEEHACYGSGVFEGYAGYLCGVDDA